jgi:predicted MFS family arabinose efflux permease
VRAVARLRRGAGGWPVVIAHGLVGAGSQLVWLSYAGVTTVAARHFRVPEAAVGWLAQVFPLLYVVLAVPAGLVLDRWFRPGLVLGACLTAAGAVLRLVGAGYGWALAGQLLAAVAQPLVLNAVTGVSGHYLTPKDRSAGIALGTAGTFAGMALAFVLGAALPDASGIQALTAIGAGLAVTAAVALLAGLRFCPRQPLPSSGANDRTPRATWGDPFIRRLCLLVFFAFGVFVSLTTFAEALLAPAGVPGSRTSAMLLCGVVAGVIGCAFVPVFAARRHQELPVMALAGLLAVVCAVLLALAPGPATGGVSLVVVGLALLPAMPLVLELAERRTGRAEGTASGLIWMAGNLGGLVFATVTGLAVGRPAAAFLILAAAAALALVVLAGLRPFMASLGTVSADVPPEPALLP